VLWPRLCVCVQELSVVASLVCGCVCTQELSVVATLVCGCTGT
jgi:hypothetical protein